MNIEIEKIEVDEIFVCIKTHYNYIVNTDGDLENTHEIFTYGETYKCCGRHVYNKNVFFLSANNNGTQTFNDSVIDIDMYSYNMNLFNTLFVTIAQHRINTIESIFA